jgi:hypothetical protein
MKAQLKRNEIYTLTIGTVELAHLTVQSQWEGMTKLVSPDGQILIVSGLKRGGFGETFNAIFGDIFGTGDDSDVVIHMASPDLALKLKQAAVEVSA